MRKQIKSGYVEQSSTPALHAQSRFTGIPILVLYAALVFLITYVTDSSRPRADSVTLGWYAAWADQIEYYNMVEGISHGNLGRGMYPPVYPFLGWIGSFFTPKDPFVLVNLFGFLLFVWCWAKLYTTFLPAGISILSAVILIHVTVGLFETPWTTTVTAVGIAAIAYMYEAKQPSWMSSVATGVALGLIFGARVGDVIMAAAAVLLFIIVTRPSLRFILGISLIAALIISSIILLNYHYTGYPLGNYVQRVMHEGFNVTSIPIKLYGYFIDSWSFDRQYTAPPVIRAVPLFTLFPAGLFLLFRYERRLALLFIVVTASWLGIYGAYSFVSGASLIYGSIHYVKVLFPIFIGCGSYAIARWTHQTES